MLRVSDVRQVAQTGESVLADAKMQIAMPSQKECEAKKEQLSSILTNYFHALTIEGCKESGFETFLNTSLLIPIILAGKTHDTESVFSIRIDAEGEALTLHTHL